MGWTIRGWIFLPMAQQSLMGKGGLITEASRSYSVTPHSVGLFWMRDQPVAGPSTWQHRERHQCARRNSDPQSSKRADADPRLRPLGHWVRPGVGVPAKNCQLPEKRREKRCTYTTNGHAILFFLWGKKVSYSVNMHLSTCWCAYGAYDKTKHREKNSNFPHHSFFAHIS
jgi:hypothetical protein